MKGNNGKPVMVMKKPIMSWFISNTKKNCNSNNYNFFKRNNIQVKSMRKYQQIKNNVYSSKQDHNQNRH